MKYKCPFCDTVLPKDEMQFHVGIPLCMEIRKTKSLTEVLSHPIKEFAIPVPKLDLEYFGEKNLRVLIKVIFDRMTYGHPDADKPFELEKFRKGVKLNDCDVCNGDVSILEIHKTLGKGKKYELCESHQNELLHKWALKTMEYVNG